MPNSQLYFQPLGTATGSTDPPSADHRCVSSTPALASTFVNTQAVNSSVNPGYVAGSDEDGGSEQVSGAVWPMVLRKERWYAVCQGAAGSESMTAHSTPSDRVMHCANPLLAACAEATGSQVTRADAAAVAATDRAARRPIAI